MPSEGAKHKILLSLIAITIIGEVLSIILWTTQPKRFKFCWTHQGITHMKDGKSKKEEAHV